MEPEGGLSDGGIVEQQQKSEALEAFTTPIYSKKAQPTPINKDLQEMS